MFIEITHVFLQSDVFEMSKKKRPRKRGFFFQDILHYQKIVVALTETSRLLGEIDRINIE